ncbi:MAG TPA: transketolase C-terminal domain-containing protein [Candidatus Paceibacterota bacterium]|jgi:transketolase|nr:transketolase C-terminal domain-containing protein [Candidatus Paceibacterota bacterium]
MLNPELKLNPDVFSPDGQKKASRDGFGEGLLLAGEMNPQVVALCADVTESVRMHLFRDRFPERFIEVGIAEQNLAAVASGLAAVGKIPVIGSYAVFSPGRNWEQIRTTICYNQQKVIIVGSHAGLNVGPDGATHQALEDIALTRVLPNLSVVVPSDYLEARKAILAAVNYPSSVYLRLAREKSPLITTLETPFEIGKSQVLWLPDEQKGENFSGITIVSCGFLVYETLMAAKELAEEGIFVTVINNSSIKPLDEKLILEWAKKSKYFLTVEEHQISGGMGSAIAEFLSSAQPTLIKFLGVKDSFGETGQAEELIEKYQLNKTAIKNEVKKILNK